MRFVVLILQAILLAILLFVPFGFEQDSSWGLNYGHFFLVLAIYVITLLVGLIETVVERQWKYVLLQSGVGVFALIVFMLVLPR